MKYPVVDQLPIEEKPTRSASTRRAGELALAYSGRALAPLPHPPGAKAKTKPSCLKKGPAGSRDNRVQSGSFLQNASVRLPQTSGELPTSPVGTDASQRKIPLPEFTSFPKHFRLRLPTEKSPDSSTLSIFRAVRHTLASSAQAEAS